MIFLERQYPLPEIVESESQRTLYEAVTQRVMPLERQYCLLLSCQYTKLRQLLQEPGLEHELEQDQRSELSSWVTELQRTLKSHAVGDNEPLTVQKTASCSNALWMLFGSNDHEKVGENIDRYCHRRAQQIAHIRQQLMEISSLSALKKQLKKRQRNEPHISRFLDESPRVYSQLYS